MLYTPSCSGQHAAHSSCSRWRGQLLFLMTPHHTRASGKSFCRASHQILRAKQVTHPDLWSHGFLAVKAVNSRPACLRMHVTCSFFVYVQLKAVVMQYHLAGEALVVQAPQAMRPALTRLQQPLVCKLLLWQSQIKSEPSQVISKPRSLQAQVYCAPVSNLGQSLRTRTSLHIAQRKQRSSTWRQHSGMAHSALPNVTWLCSLRPHCSPVFLSNCDCPFLMSR